MNCVLAFNQPNSNIHCLFAADDIKVPESCLLSCLFCMLGLLSVSTNHRPPKQVAEQGLTGNFCGYRLQSLAV